MKNIIRVWVLMLLAGLLCTAALAEESYTVQNSVVTGVPSGAAEIVIPAEADGVPVTIVGDFVMYGNDEIVSIRIPEGVTLMENASVYACEALEELTLPDTLQVISTYTVYSCDSLQKVTIPAAVRFVGNYSFYACDNLRSVTFLGSAPQLSEYSFQALADDVVFYVPSDCVEEYAAALPEGSVIEPSGQNAVAVSWTATEDELVFDAATGTITDYTGEAMAVDVPAAIGGVAVTAIGENAFAGNEHTPRFVRLPEGLTEIGSGAFSHSMLLAVAFPSTLEIIGDDAFSWAVDCQPIWAAENGVRVIGKNAFEATDAPAVLTLPEGVAHIGESAFATNHLGELYLPASIETIGAQAFVKSPDLSYICFAGNTMPEIAADAFDCQTALEDVDIGWQASRAEFEEARQLFEALGMTNCTVWRNNPSAVGAAKSVGKYGIGATYEGGLLTACDEDTPDVTVFTSFDGVNTTGVGEACFENNQTIRSFYPHHADWFATIGARAFTGSSLETVELFDSITEIGEEAFAATRLTSVTIPESLECIGGGAFARCADLREVRLFCDAALLPDDCFADCPNAVLYVPNDIRITDGLALARRLGVAVLRMDGSPLLAACPYPADNAADYSIDETFARLDHYWGWSVNLMLPAEKDGVTLAMLSANTLSRARAEAGEAELPVRSVVVPESYEQLVYGCFADLPDAEVIVVYGVPAEIGNGTFSNCPKLREVIFVNGAGCVRAYAFQNCPALETVYLGEAQVDENAFADCGAMTADTLAAELPDVDALLAAVKSDPMTPPEMTEAAPISMADTGFDLLFRLLDMLETAIQNVRTDDYGMEISPMPADDGHAATNGDEAAVSQPDALENVQTLGDAEFVGEWSCIWMATGGSTGNDPRAMYGADWRITLNADGTGSLDIGGPEPGTWNVDENGITRYNDMPITLRADGRLQYGSAQSGGMIFSKTPGDVWNAESDAFVNPGEAAAAQVSQQGAAQHEAEGAAVSAPTGMAERLNQKYVCKTVQTGGMQMDAAMLGGEYAITFAENGDALFAMAGYEVPGLRWTADETAFYVTYFDGNDFVFVPTEAGFDLDFYGSMLMHFTPEE